MHVSNKTFAWLLGGAMLGAGFAMQAPALALSGDKQQPMDVESDTFESDDQSGVTVFKGKVKVTQGTLVIQADTVTLHRGKDGKIARVLGEGKPAHYRQRRDGKEVDVVAQARELEYLADQDKMILREDARIVQDRDVFTSRRIVYDMAKDLVHAGGKQKGDRVRMTIQPDAPTKPDKGGAKPEPQPKP